MSRFLTPLRLERIEDTSRDGRGTWRLLSDLVYDSDLAGVIIVPAGTITDLASVPRLPFAYLLTGGLAHAAAVVHDWLYTTRHLGRKRADAVFKEATLALGVSGWQAWLMWVGVRAGGGSSWDAPGPEQPEHVAGQIEAAQPMAP